MKLILLALVLIAFPASAQMWPNPGPGHAAYAVGGAAGDYSDDADCEAFYPFEGTAGTGDGQDKNDECTQGADNDLTVSATPNPGIQTTCGDSNSAGTQCYQNDGVDGYWETAESADFDNNPMTVGCMFYKTGTGDHLAFSRFSTSTVSGFSLTLEGSEVLGGDLGTSFITTTGSYALDTWHSTIMRWGSAQNSGNVQIFLDGTLDANGVPNTSSTANDNVDNETLKIGAYYAGSPLWINGRLNDCFIYSASLSNAQICEIARKGFRGTDTDRGYSCTLP